MESEHEQLVRAKDRINRAIDYLEEKGNEIVTQVDEEGCPYEHLVGLTASEEYVYLVLKGASFESETTSNEAKQ